ncbi:MAG: zinc-binding dehydrogenase [Gammaproteobacteria bacterium]|nr:zinc-binding dehydrogenase [Gammaproteobacteria bacterium]
MTDAATCIGIPANMPDADAAAVPETFLTAYDAIWLKGRMPDAGWCLVRAATSGVGIAACQLARALGVHAIATSRSAGRAAALAPFEPAGTIIEGEEDLAARVRELTDKRGVDVVLDLVGGSGSGAAVDALRTGGTLMLVGIMGGARSEFNLARILTGQLTVLGTTMRNRPLDQRRHLAAIFTDRVLPLLQNGALRPVVDRVMPVTQVADAHRLIESNQHLGKIVLAWD